MWSRRIGSYESANAATPSGDTPPVASTTPLITVSRADTRSVQNTASACTRNVPAAESSSSLHPTTATTPAATATAIHLLHMGEISPAGDVEAA